MRHILFFGLVCATSALSAGSSHKECPPPGPQKETPKPKQAIQMRDQHDQTDLYAIPLDSSEEEQNEELRDLSR